MIFIQTVSDVDKILPQDELGKESFYFNLMGVVFNIYIFD